MKYLRYIRKYLRKNSNEIRRIFAFKNMKITTLLHFLIASAVFGTGIRSSEATNDRECKNYLKVKTEVKKDELESDSEHATNVNIPPVKTKKEEPLRRKRRIGERQKLLRGTKVKSEFGNDVKNVESDLEENPNENTVFIRGDKFCRFCRVNFRYARHYTLHFKKDHPGKKAYLCPSSGCPFKSKNRTFFIRHIKSTHPGQIILSRHSESYQVIECEACRTEHIGVIAFQKHIISQHRGQKLIKCGLCEARFSWFANLATHEMEMHGMHDTEFRCKFCKSPFFRSDVMDAHVKKCRERNVLKKIGENKIDVNGLEKEDFRTCSECGEKQKNISALKDHFRSAHPGLKGCFLCKICRSRFLTFRRLDIHVDRHHADVCEPMKNFRKKQLYCCPYCREEFWGLKSYEDHGVSAHGKDEKLFRCAECDKSFHLKRILKGHIRSVHKVPSIPCRHCGKLFPIKGRKNYHEKRCGGKMET